MVPVLGFAAFSGTGKTTLIEQIIPKLKAAGLRVAVVKHDAHGLKFDKEGKDSWRFSAAGADYSIVNGPEQSAIFVSRPLSMEEAVGMITDVDLILIEGYKTGAIDKVGISRVETGKGFPGEPTDFKALVTDDATFLGRAAASVLAQAGMQAAPGQSAASVQPAAPGQSSALGQSAASVQPASSPQLPPVFALDDVDGITNWILDTYIYTENA